VLNARLYRTCWLVAAVALVVALLTLQPPRPGPEPPLPSAFTGETAQDLANRMSVTAAERVAGSPADEAAARFVEQELSQIPRARGRVQRQPFEARVDGRAVRLRNVYLAVPGPPGAPRRAGIVIVATRDTPPGVAAGASASAVLIRLAQLSATTAHDRPHLFVSVDGGTLGHAGLRWFLHRFSAFPIAAVVAIEDPGAGDADSLYVWSAGQTDKQARGLAEIADTAVSRAGARPISMPPLGQQLLRLAVPQTSGPQGAAIAEGIPAVTLAGRPERPLASGEPPSAERLTLIGDAASNLLGALDVIERPPAPDASLRMAGKTLRPTVARLALLLLALPVLAAAIDAVARMRRARVPLAGNLAALPRRVAPFLAALVAGYGLVLVGLLPGSAAGAPPQPAAVPFDARGGLGLALMLVAAVATWGLLRRGLRRPRATPAGEAAAALVVLALLVVAAWLVTPFSLVLALPAAHAGLVATAARRRWQVAALALVAAAPLILVCWSLSSRLDRNPFFAGWYLLDSMVNGSRGAVGPVLAALVLGCVWALGGLVAFRAQKGLVATPAAARRERHEARERARGSARGRGRR
jgi:hypothetical protein